MKSTRKYFIEERFRMMPMPYWWQLFKWIKYTWRKLRYMAWKRRGQIFRRCIVCHNKITNSNNSCKNCQTDYKKWKIEAVDESKYTQLLEKIGETKTSDNSAFLEEPLAQALEKSSIQPLENHLKRIGKVHQTNWKPFTEKLKDKLILQFTKFPTITRKDVAEYRKNNPTK